MQVSINIPAKQQKMIKKISNELSEIREGLHQTAKSSNIIFALIVRVLTTLS